MKTLIKEFNASMPINHYDENILKLMVYGTAYFTFATQLQKDYNIIEVNERFRTNEICEIRTLYVEIKLQRKDK